MRAAALVATAALLLALTGCGGSDLEDLAPEASGLSAGQVRAAEQRLLDRRVEAVQKRNQKQFLAAVDHTDRPLLARQRRYFRNLVQLPLAKFRYTVLERDWAGVGSAPGWGPNLHAPEVRLTLQLEGYDEVPVERTVGFVFSFRDGKALIVSDRTSDGRALRSGTPAPWDLTAITVREDQGVLGIFDRQTASSAEEVAAAVRNGMDEIGRALPYSWPRRVVVYGVQSPRVLKSFTEVPGGALARLGALTFPTYSDARRSRVASTRMLVMASSIRAGQPFLGRIIRHELSHIAIGVHDDGAPTWVSEGIAEYLGARDTPTGDRIIPTAALDRASTVTPELPSSAEFNNTDQEWHYALSWMACDYIAATSGEDRLWELVDAMRNGGEGTTDAQQDRVLLQVLGYDGSDLAERAARRIRRLFG